jgi:hypothetical protein
MINGKEMVMYLCFFHNMDGELRGWKFPSEDHEPTIQCQACRAESVRRMKKRLPPFFTLLEILQFERNNPTQSRSLRPVIPAEKVLDTLMKICGPDIGRKKYHQLVELMMDPDLLEEMDRDRDENLAEICYLHSVDDE